jgi:hypothetical protein
MRKLLELGANCQPGERASDWTDERMLDGYVELVDEIAGFPGESDTSARIILDSALRFLLQTRGATWWFECGRQPEALEQLLADVNEEKQRIASLRADETSGAQRTA